MKHLLLLLAASLFLGCSSASLRYQNDAISFQTPDKAVHLSGKTLYSSQKNLGKISVRQHVFEERHKERLVYEFARIQTGHSFKYNYQYILRQIFDAQEVNVIQDENGLGFFTVKMKGGDTLNAIVKTDTKRSLSMLYGFTDENFKALLSDRTLLVQKTHESKAEEAIKSRWDMKLIIFGTLLEQESQKVLKKVPLK